MKAQGTLILTRTDIASLLSMKACIHAVEDAFRMRAESRALATGMLHIESQDGEFHIKAGGLKLERTYFGLKANGGFFRNVERYGLPNIQGAILLFDGDNGYPLALMDSIEITAQRTGAATAVAARHLARASSSVVTIFGCGIQGRAQLGALKHVFPSIELVHAFDLDRQRAAAYAAEMEADMGVPVVAGAGLEEATARSDIIVTCTPSRQYYLCKHHVGPGTFIAAVGADSPDKQELEPSLMIGNKVVVDIYEQCAKVGEVHHALELGLIRPEDVHGELGEVIVGRLPGRTSAQEIIIFDATGTALQDVAAAAVVYERALGDGVGRVVNLSEGGRKVNATLCSE